MAGGLPPGLTKEGALSLGDAESRRQGLVDAGPGILVFGRFGEILKALFFHPFLATPLA